MNLTKDDKIALHRMFSPYKIPLGFTDEEIRLLIKLDSLRDELREHNLGYFLITLNDMGLSKNLDDNSPKTSALKEALYNFMLLWANK